MIDAILKSTVHPLKRGFPMYPTNGLMPTKWMVKLSTTSDPWLRVYDAYDSKTKKFYPVVKVAGVSTPIKPELVDYDFHAARKI